MASVDEVTGYLAKRAANVIYPGGSRLPGMVNTSVKVYPGWPVPGTLQQDIEAGHVHVSVWPLPSERRISTPLGRPCRLKEKGAPTLQITVNGSMIGVSGHVSASTIVKVSLDDSEYDFQFHAGKTAEDVVSALSQKLPRSFVIINSICVLMTGSIRVSINTAGTAVRELRRQIKEFQITVWAPTPALRNRVGSLLDVWLSEMSHIDLNDGAPAQIFFARQYDSDTAENWHVYRRDLICSVNYATTQNIAAPVVTDITLTLNGNRSG